MWDPRRHQRHEIFVDEVQPKPTSPRHDYGRSLWGPGNMPPPLADLSLYVVMVTTVVLLDLIFMRSSGYKIMTQTLHHTANTTLHPTANTTPSPNVTDYLGEYYSTILNCLARISVYTRVWFGLSPAASIKWKDTVILAILSFMTPPATIHILAACTNVILSSLLSPQSHRPSWSSWSSHPA